VASKPVRPVHRRALGNLTTGQAIAARQVIEHCNGEPASPVKPFKKPLGALDGEIASRLITSTMDIALVLNRDGIVQDFSVSDDALSKEALFTSLVGKSWVDTVTSESRQKVIDMLRDAASKSVPRWRQVNHPSNEGSDLPVRYSAINIGANGKILAVGRELRSLSTLQQRLINAQQSMEREYARLRLSETRYRLLFQTGSEAVIIVDAQTLRIVEFNPAAERIFGRSARKKLSKTLPDLADASSAATVKAFVQSIRTTGRTDDARVLLSDQKTEATITGSLFRQDAASYILIRIAPIAAETIRRDDATINASLKRVIEGMPDGFVVAGTDRRILASNTAFLELAQLATDEQARGEHLERWLGRSPVDLEALISNVAELGTVRHFETIVRGEYGTTEDVEISAVYISDREQPCFGLTIRSIGRRATSETVLDRDLPRSVKQMTGLVGQVPLKNLVRETTDLIERLCIEAALELVGDNRANAAEMLGLSRQSLYVKLRRYGLGDLGPEN